MAEGLAKKGHHPRTLDQVWAKVKELRQGYARAHEHSSTSGEAPQHCAYFQELDRILGDEEPFSTRVLVESGLQTPIQHCQKVDEDNPEEQQLQDEEEEDPNRSVVSLTLEPVPQSQEASQAFSDPGEGTSAGPARADQHATPVPPPTWAHGSRRHWWIYTDFMRRHIEVLKRMEETMAERTRAEARWHDRFCPELLELPPLDISPCPPPWEEVLSFALDQVVENATCSHHLRDIAFSHVESKLQAQIVIGKRGMFEQKNVGC
nr:uncharacterized protein LOC102463117 [Pelodiscus sinensis]|eukprot:XP_025046190.1 uncharacterized protein LOC102463117 [Pelodiscus sinensis]